MSDAASGSSGSEGLLEPDPRYGEISDRVSAQQGVDRRLVQAVIQVESGYQERARSRKGAMGLMQLMPGTARAMGVMDPFDPRQNVLGGTRYLRVLANRFGGDLVLTIAAYNAGEGAVDKYRGIPPYAETRRYVQRVLGHYYELRAASTLRARIDRALARR